MTAFEAALLAWAMGGLDALLGNPRALSLVACWAVAGVSLTLLRRPVSRQHVASVSEGRLLLASLGLIPLLIPPLSAFTARAGLWVLPGGSPLGWAGVGLSALGLIVRIAAIARLGGRFSPILAVQPVHELETRGLYSRIRHPGYLGSWLASLGAALVFGSMAGAAAALLLGGLLVARARREETLLQRHFGEAWLAYRARTGAFLPRLGRRVSAR